MRRTWKTILLALALAVDTAGVRADDPRWRTAFAAPASATPAAAQAVRLGRPVPLSDTEAPLPAPVQPAVPSPEPANPGPRFVRAQSPDLPQDALPVPPVPPVPPAGMPPPPPPPPPAPSSAGAGTAESYLCGQVTTSKSGGFFERVGEIPGNAVRGVGGFFAGTGGRAPFQSDSCFPWMISPVSEPFFAEDPRALTELRPIFMIQAVPHRNDVLHGGNVGWVGLQGRLALTERLSIVVNKLGLVWTDPHDTTDGFHRNVGFSELWLGPKYTFIRNDQTRTLLAGGLTFQIPVGPGSVYQNTGNLTLAPYLSFAQNFLQTAWGSLNFMNTTGYAFATDNQRTNYLYTQFHLDWDVWNWHKIYPLIEFNWTHYTQNGGARYLDFEGNDLFNFGSRGIAGKNYYSLAFGFRYKFCEGIQIGTALQFPFLTRNNLESFRWTIDMIFRY